MSRIGKAPIPIPNGVTVNIDHPVVTVEGPKGQLTHTVPATISVKVADVEVPPVDDQPSTGKAVLVERADDTRTERSLHGLTRSLINNMCVGVSEGYTKELNIVGVGYRAVAKGPKALELSLGFSHTVAVEAPEGITFEAPNQTTINVVGFDKQLVGQVAANIRALRKPEPYKGKGIRYADERVIRKAGKAAK